MAVSKTNQQVKFSLASFVSVAADSQATSDIINLSTNSVAAQLTVKSDQAPAVSTWSQRGSDIDGEAVDDFFGTSVSFSSDGSVLAIGAYGAESDHGHTKVYDWSGSAWVQKGSNIIGEATLDLSGTSVSLSSDGSIVAIGAYGNDGTGAAAGHVRVYAWSGSAWVQRGADIDGEAANDFSGRSVSLSSDGTIVAIGAHRNDGTGSNAGHVRVYEWNGIAWAQKGADIDGEAADDNSGISVSLSSDGSIVAVGAYLNDGTDTNAGHVRVYEYSGSSWGQIGADIDGEAADDYSGYRVSLSSDGAVVAIGAYNNDGTGTNAGHVRVYEYSDGSWSQKGSDIDGEAAGDGFGSSVSLSSDGSIVAIAAYANDGTDTDAGHVRVYEYSGSSWSQKGADIDGEAAGDGSSGMSVSLSSDGSIVAIGAQRNDGTGSNAGHVRVYSSTTSGSPSSGDTVDFYILYSTGDPDGVGVDEYDTPGHALHVTILDLNIEDPAQKTVDIPVSAKAFKVYVDNNGASTVTCSIELYETLIS